MRQILNKLKNKIKDWLFKEEWEQIDDMLKRIRNCTEGYQELARLEMKNQEQNEEIRKISTEMNEYCIKLQKVFPFLSSISKRIEKLEKEVNK